MNVRKLDKYLALRFMKMIIVAVSSFVVIFVSVDAFDHFTRWVDKDVSPGTFLQYYFYGLPYIIVLVLPIAVLLSSLFLITSLSRRNELVAMRAAGISIPRILLPLFLVGALASLFELGVGDFIVSNATYQQSQVKRVQIDGQEPINYARRSAFAHRSPNGAILDIGFFNGETEILTDVTVEWFDDSSRITRRLDLDRMIWSDTLWTGIGAIDRVFGPSGALVYTISDSLALPGITETPEDFGSRQKAPQEMNFFELWNYIQRVDAAGGDSRGDMVEFYLKILFPLSNLIMVMVGAPLALRNPRSGKASSIGLAILLAFIFFSLLRFGQTLGHKGALPPLLAASIAEIVFIVLGLFLLTRASRV
ncbi:MAG: LptF/LptG family permease [Candidatus Fermentibacteraceae bacterium]|nr:LptF/LptG family permease [Candidatus Fermentibacteraceae bacterium]